MLHRQAGVMRAGDPKARRYEGIITIKDGAVEGNIQHKSPPGASLTKAIDHRISDRVTVEIDKSVKDWIRRRASGLFPDGRYTILIVRSNN